MPGTTLILILFWVASIIWVAIDAGKRGISPVFWTFVTVMTGPLGLLAYGIVRELKK